MQQAVDSIALSLPGTVAVFVADSETGLLEMADQQSASEQNEAVAAYYAQVMRLQRRALEATGVGQQKMQNMVFQSSRHYHALYPVEGNRFLCVVVDQRQTNLAMLWRLLATYAPQLQG